MKNKLNSLLHFVFVVSIFLVGCKKEDDFIQTPESARQQSLEKLIEGIDDHLPEDYDKDAWKAEVFRPDAIPSGTREVQVPNFQTGKMETRIAQIIDGYVVLEGDIVLGTEADLARQEQQVELRGSVTNKLSRRWEYNIIPYKDFSSHPRSEKIQEAMDEVASKTNLIFVKHTNEEKYLQIYESNNGNYVMGIGAPISGDWSDDGAVTSKRRPMFITDDAGKGTIMHELLHVAGMAHEQARCDRDKHVKVYKSNIKSGWEDQYDKNCSGDGFSDVYNYDFGSIMHYGPWACSKNSLPTMVPNTPWAHEFYPRLFQMGQRNGLSKTDINTVNHMYPIDKNSYYGMLTLYTVPNTSNRLAVVGIGDRLYLDSWKGRGPQRFQFLPATDGYYYIKHVDTGKYLDINGASTANGAYVTLYTHNGNNNQQFRLEPVNWGTYRIIARHSNKEINTDQIYYGEKLKQNSQKHTGAIGIIKL